MAVLILQIFIMSDHHFDTTYRRQDFSSNHLIYLHSMIASFLLVFHHYWWGGHKGFTGNQEWELKYQARTLDWDGAAETNPDHTWLMLRFRRST